MCWTVRLFYNLFCDSAASLRVCCHFNILSTFQLLQNTFITCHTSLASSLLAYFEPFLFSCEETKYFITDINIVLHRFCILQECFSQYLGDVLDGFFFLWIFKNSRMNKVKDVTENDVIIWSALMRI